MENIRLQDDLYEAVNGEWLAQAVIPDDKPTTGGFSLLAEEVEKTMMADFADFASGKKSSDVKSMDDAVRLYRKVVDTERRNSEGIRPVEKLLERIRNTDTVEKLNKESRELSKAGMEMPFQYGVEADMKDATSNSFIITGPNLILPDTTYYQDDNPVGPQLMAVYTDMAAKLLAYTDLSEEMQKQYIEDMVAFDKLVAQKVKSQLEWADYVKNYNPFSIDEVAEYMKPFDFKGFMKQIYGENIPQTIIVFDPKAIKEMNFYFNEETFSQYVHWAYVKTLISASSKLSEEMAAIGNIYRRTLMGIAADPVIEKQAYQVASSVYSEPVGIYYGRTYFGEEAKKDITELVKRIIATWIDRVKKNTFLQQSTKDKAVLKLSTITMKLGYPDQARELYDRMHVAEEDSYYESMQKISVIREEDNLNKLYKKVDRTEWQMPGHMVNACYDPSRNDITFPAAILQKPFYSINQTLSENLGGIGAVISHEISHAFDNNGSHFDENGNLFNWWTDEDFANFDKMTKLMIKQWDGIEYAGGKVNGELVVSENIADNGGIAVSLQIMHESENTSFEEYFRNWAKVWCMKAKEAYMQLLLVNDVHSPAKLRANIQVRNFQEWYDTFDVKETDQMYIPEEDRIIIW